MWREGGTVLPRKIKSKFCERMTRDKKSSRSPGNNGQPKRVQPTRQPERHQITEKLEKKGGERLESGLECWTTEKSRSDSNRSLT